MNHCDLEETRRLVEAKIDQAIADVAGWELEASLFFGWISRSMRHESSRIVAIKESGHAAPQGDGVRRTVYRVSMNGVNVGAYSEESDRYTDLDVLLETLQEQEECRRLLVALNPPLHEPARIILGDPPKRPWWRFWK